MSKTSFHERTLVLIKPDGVQRGLIGELISRFERKGLKIVAMKMEHPTIEKARQHYYWTDEEKRSSGERTIAGYKERGIEINKDPISIGENTQQKLLTYLSTGPVVAMIIEGAHAIQYVRKLRGATNPLGADVGTISADYTIDSYEVADEGDRSIRNLVHCSGNQSEAEREMKLWFSENEIFSYDLAIEKILYDTDWEVTRKQLTNK